MGSTLVNIDQIFPNPNNPRKHFDQAALEDLAQSIREHGIIQPLVVKCVGLGDGESLQYRLICGERRWRAAQLAGLDKVPVVYRVSDTEELSDAAEALKMLVENLQREDLDPIEEATAFHWVLGEFDMTQEELADQLGVSQGHIANRIRLLDLPDSVKQNISRGIISASHGKVLAGHRNLPAAVMEKAVEAIANDNVPVAKADTLVLRLVAEKGLPLFDNYRKKPEFKSGKGSECYTCGNRAMGKDMYVSGDNEQPFCLKPECWETKQEAAQQKKLEKAQNTDEVDISKLNYTQYSYWSRDDKSYDQSECKDCEHLKKSKGGSMLYCLDPSCMKKKKAAKTKADNAKKKDTFQAELGQIKEMVAGWNDQAARIDRTTLIYLAAQVIANVDTWHDRKVTRYQYLKNKFGWDNDLLKSGAYNLLYHDWDSFHRLLETLDERQLLEVIMEWPAVARGLKGAEGWFLQQVPEVETKMEQLAGKWPPGISDRVGWILHNSADDFNYDSAIPKLTDNELMYCLQNEGRKTGLRKLAAEARRRGLPVPVLQVPLKEEPGDDDQEPDRLPENRYQDKNGRVILVSTGLGGSEFGTFWESPAGGKHRVKTAAMPMTPSKKEAQRNLDAWAEKNGLQLVESKEAEGVA